MNTKLIFNPKRITLLVSIVFLFYTPIYCIDFYEKGDSLYNLAKSGLFLRIGKNSNSTAIGNIPFGQKIEILERKDYLDSDESFIIDNFKIRDTESEKVKLNGRWAKVNFKGVIGFVFDCYLSRYPPPLHDDLKSYLEKEIGVVKSYSILNQFEEGTERIIFNDGIFFTQTVTGSTSEFRLIIPDYSFEESLLLIYHLNSYIVKFEKRENGEYYVFLECGEYQIIISKNVAILCGGFGC